jgi:hypothetical protein
VKVQSKQNATNSENTYNPTKAEQALLDVLLNPENRMKSVTDVCKVAKIDRVTYYRSFAKPEFVALYQQRSIDLIKQHVAPVINTFVREAQRGSFQHGKVLLEMAGVYTEKLEHSGQVNTNTDKLDAILKQLKER